MAADTKYLNGLVIPEEYTTYSNNQHSDCKSLTTKNTSDLCERIRYWLCGGTWVSGSEEKQYGGLIETSEQWRTTIGRMKVGLDTGDINAIGTYATAYLLPALAKYITASYGQYDQMTFAGVNQWLPTGVNITTLWAMLTVEPAHTWVDLNDRGFVYNPDEAVSVDLFEKLKLETLYYCSNDITTTTDQCAPGNITIGDTLSINLSTDLNVCNCPNGKVSINQVVDVKNIVDIWSDVDYLGCMQVLRLLSQTSGTIDSVVLDVVKSTITAAEISVHYLSEILDGLYAHDPCMTDKITSAALDGAMRSQEKIFVTEL